MSDNIAEQILRGEADDEFNRLYRVTLTKLWTYNGKVDIEAITSAAILTACQKWKPDRASKKERPLDGYVYLLARCRCIEQARVVDARHKKLANIADGITCREGRRIPRRDYDE